MYGIKLSKVIIAANDNAGCNCRNVPQLQKCKVMHPIDIHDQFLAFGQQKEQRCIAFPHQTPVMELTHEVGMAVQLLRLDLILE